MVSVPVALQYLSMKCIHKILQHILFVVLYRCDGQFYRLETLGCEEFLFDYTTMTGELELRFFLELMPICTYCVMCARHAVDQFCVCYFVLVYRQCIFLYCNIPEGSRC